MQCRICFPSARPLFTTTDLSYSIQADGKGSTRIQERICMKVVSPPCCWQSYQDELGKGRLFDCGPPAILVLYSQREFYSLWCSYIRCTSFLYLCTLRHERIMRAASYRICIRNTKLRLVNQATFQMRPVQLENFNVQVRACVPPNLQVPSSLVRHFEF